jgi:hypothetical protein
VNPSGALARGRAQAESLMRAAVTITRVSGTVRDTDGYDQPSTTPVYTGKARIVRATTAPNPVDVAGQTLTVVRPQINLPVGAYTMQVGDVATVTANPDDVSLVGHRYRLAAEAPAGSMSVQYKIPAEEIL